MSISSDISSGPYTANGSQTAFPFTFTAVTGAEVAVTVDGVTVNTGFTVTLTAAPGNGGTVTFSSPPASGAVVLLSSSPDYIQDSYFENQGAYSLSSVNAINRRQSVRSNWLYRKVSAVLAINKGEKGDKGDTGIGVTGPEGPAGGSVFPNGTMQRWLTAATDAGSGASGTVQAAMVTVEQQLYSTGLINKIVRLNLRVGTSAAAARIPFVMRFGCGAATEAGTLSSFTQASGLTGFALDTGLTFDQAGLGAYNLGLGAYVLSSPGGTPSAYMLRASDNAWGFSPLYASGINFAFALMSTFSASPFDKPDVSAVAGGVYTAPVLGTMTCVRDKSGVCSTYRNGIYLPQIAGNSPVSNTPLTQNLYVDTVTFASGGDWVTDALTPGEVTQLHWIIHNFNVAIGRGVTAEGL